MIDKLELLLHIDAPTRKEVLKWCKDYEDEIQRLKAEVSNRVLYRQIYDVVGNVSVMIKKKGKCSVFFDGRFKVLTQPSRVEKESSMFVGTYDENYVAEYLVEDIKCTLSDAAENGVLFKTPA
jgi:hypothetical protein